MVQNNGMVQNKGKFACLKSWQIVFVFWGSQIDPATRFMCKKPHRNIYFWKYFGSKLNFFQIMAKNFVRRLFHKFSNDFYQMIFTKVRSNQNCLPNKDILITSHVVHPHVLKKSSVKNRLFLEPKQFLVY